MTLNMLQILCLIGFQLLAMSHTFAQTQVIARISGLKPCSPDSNIANKLITEKLLFESQSAEQFISQRKKYQALSLPQQDRVIHNVETHLKSFGRLGKPVSKKDHHKMGFEIEKVVKSKFGQGTESVGAGGDLGGSGFNPNQQVFILKNSQDVKCWTYLEQEGATQVFDYDGFEEVATISSSKQGSCSAVIVGQNHALTARHCAENGLLLIPTKESRFGKTSTARITKACKTSHQYKENCEFEVVEYRNVEKFQPYSTTKLSLDFQPTNNGRKSYFTIQGGNSFGTPDMRLLEFKRNQSSIDKKAKLVTAKLANYSTTTAVNSDGYFPFVRAGYGHSLELITPSLTIGSWKSSSMPVQASNVSNMDSEEKYAYVALFHPPAQKSRICKGDSGGALFSGMPNGKEPDGTRLLVGIISAAQSHQSALDCLKSPVEISQIINSRYIELLCKAADSQLTGCKKQ